MKNKYVFTGTTGTATFDFESKTLHYERSGWLAESLKLESVTFTFDEITGVFYTPAKSFGRGNAMINLAINGKRLKPELSGADHADITHFVLKGNQNVQEFEEAINLLEKEISGNLDSLVESINQSSQITDDVTEDVMINAAYELCKEQLKCPSTASLVNGSIIDTDKYNRRLIKLEVDAQNSYGAMLRETYYVVINGVDDDKKAIVSEYFSPTSDIAMAKKTGKWDVDYYTLNEAPAISSEEKAEMWTNAAGVSLRNFGSVLMGIGILADIVGAAMVGTDTSLSTFKFVLVGGSICFVVGLVLRRLK